MKTILTLFVPLLFLQPVLAQTETSLVLKGTVVDSIKNGPINYATVTLLDSAGKQVKSTLTKVDGSFELNASSIKFSKLAFSFVGYQTKVMSIKPSDTDLGRIILSPAGKNLNEIVITTAKPIIKQEVDRISYEVQNDPESKVLTVLDMLRKVPLITVDGTDKIRLKGNDNYKILINGRESSLIARNPSDVFKAMPASNIDKIEVITTPPAKYDAEGLAGIINIITKKKIDQGYNGSINSSYSSTGGPGGNINVTVKQKKIGFAGYTGYHEQWKINTAVGNSNIILKPVQSNLVQSGNNLRSGNNLYGSAELSFEFDTLNLVTATFSSNGGKNNNFNEQTSTELNNLNQLSQYFHQMNTDHSQNKGLDFGLNYQLGFKKNKDQLLTMSYKSRLSDNTQNTDAYYMENAAYLFKDFRQHNNSGINEHTAQIDYIQPLKAITFEVGAKTIFRNNFSDFESFIKPTSSGDYVINPSQSNSFVYDQNVYSFYNSLQLKSKKWVGKAGLRLEHTTIDANFSSLGVITKRNFTNLVPSFSAQRVLNTTSNITLGFSQRIQRPNIWVLNPFVDRSNPKFINVGNPDIQPVTNQNLELKYSNFKKGSVNVGLSYSFSNNTVQNILSVDAEGVTTRTFDNVGKNNRFALDANINQTFYKKLSMSVNANLVHAGLTGTYKGQFYDNQGFQGYIFLYNTYKFKPTFNMGLNIGYDSRYVLLQGRDNDYFFYSLSTSKDILKKKLSLSLSINNPFTKYQKFDYFNSNDDFEQMNFHQILNRRVDFSVNYKFGKLNAALKKNKRGISNDDVGNSR
jgi:hypothetical protein